MTHQQKISRVYRSTRAPQRVLHFIAHYLLSRQGLKKSPTGKPRKNPILKNQSPLIAPDGKALSLLKTQFAKKPKNPV